MDQNKAPSLSRFATYFAIRRTLFCHYLRCRLSEGGDRGPNKIHRRSHHLSSLESAGLSARFDSLYLCCGVCSNSEFGSYGLPVTD